MKNDAFRRCDSRLDIGGFQMLVGRVVAGNGGKWLSQKTRERGAEGDFKISWRQIDNKWIGTRKIWKEVRRKSSCPWNAWFGGNDETVMVTDDCVWQSDTQFAYVCIHDTFDSFRQLQIHSLLKAHQTALVAGNSGNGFQHLADLAGKLLAWLLGVPSSTGMSQLVY